MAIALFGPSGQALGKDFAAMIRILSTLLLAGLLATSARAELAPREGDFIAQNFAFASGESLPELRLHYITLGTLRRDANGHPLNAVLLLHGTTGTGKNFLAPSIAGEIFGPGQPLDASLYFIIIPDGLGRGGSSKPSDGLRMKFPHYGYHDIVAAQHLLVTQGLGIEHLRLILGTSMGGMHAWMWGESHPEFADALMPIASQPVAATGRNYLWRLMLIDSIRSDPDWRGGDYEQQPPRFLHMTPLFQIMTGSASVLEARAGSHDAARKWLDGVVANGARNFDANDYLYWFAAIDDYDPEPDLGRIRARVLAVNFADDLLNPPELGVMERLIPIIPHARYVLVPQGPDTIGHATLTRARVWAPYLKQLLDTTK